jgi:DNA repair exonuclease SbcCD ATPase subunit
VQYTIIRSAKRDAKGNVRVEVDFSKEVNGEVISLNGESRRGTYDSIRNHIGSYDDFVLTSLSLQKNNSNFADKGQTDRKDLVAKFLGISIFDRLCQIATDKQKELNGVIKQFGNTDFERRVEELETNISLLGEKKDSIVSLKKTLESEMEDTLHKIVETNSKIVNLKDVPTNIDSLEASLAKAQRKLDSIDLDEMQSNCDAIHTNLDEIDSDISKMDEDLIESQLEEYNTMKSLLASIESEIEVLKVVVSGKQEKVKFLDNHEYDPECEFCMKNEFVQDAVKARDDLEELKPTVIEKISKKNELISKINELSSAPEQSLTLQKLHTQRNAVERKWNQCINGINTTEKEVIQLTSEISELNKKIKKYYDSIDVVSQNKKYQSEIVELNSIQKNTKYKNDKCNDELIKLNSSESLWKREIQECNDNSVKYDNAVFELNAYNLYISSVNRDGVPYDIISRSIPTIESEVNEILSQLVEFGVSIDMDGKNINASIVYDEKSWPIELTSGMETFISNLAIRIALTNISNMPKTNFLVIDEGLGALDADTMSSMPALFSFLRSRFEFILLISHLDQARDFVDSHVEIKKENGFSSVSQ